jgi:hypothetical protein
MIKIVRVARPLRKASANADAFGANTPAFPALAHRRIARSPAARLNQPRLSVRWSRP